MRQQSRFGIWMRTGRMPQAEANAAETKFNSWHDPDDGRFTFAGQGRYFGRGGSTAASKTPDAGPTYRSLQRARALRARAKMEAAKAAERARIIRERRERDAFKPYMIDREGDLDVVYRDSLGKETVGIGHLVTPADNLRAGERITQARKEALWRNDADRALRAARLQMRDAGITDQSFLFPLASVNFQLDTDWYREHRTTWALIKRRQYAAAAREALNSRWAAQTPKRARQFRDALLRLEQAEQARRRAPHSDRVP